MMNLPQPDLTSEGSATAANANRGLDAVRHFGQRLIWSTADPAAKPLTPTFFPGRFQHVSWFANDICNIV